MAIGQYIPALLTRLIVISTLERVREEDRGEKDDSFILFLSGIRCSVFGDECKNGIKCPSSFHGDSNVSQFIYKYNEFFYTLLLSALFTVESNFNSVIPRSWTYIYIYRRAVFSK